MSEANLMSAPSVPETLIGRRFNPYELKWIAATPLQEPALASWICERAGVKGPRSFAHFVRKNPELFERHSGLTPCWEYRLSRTGAAFLRAMQEIQARVPVTL
jgi:hypothetical protein